MSIPFNPDLTLIKDPIQLSVITQHDEVGLVQAGQDQRIWQYNPNFNHPHEFTEKWFNHALLQKSLEKRLPLVIRYHQNIIGSSSYYDFDTTQNTITIGYTWITPQYWGTGVNAIVKKLMLNHAFENGITAVYFVIDHLNQRSQKAVMKLGAKQQGIYKDHMIRPDCTMRDSIIYVITQNDFRI